MKSRKVLVTAAVILAAAFMACGQEEPAVEAAADSTADQAPDVINAPIEPVEPVMTDEEKLAYVMENCICPQCPSWIPEAGENGEGGYCATGRSECIVTEAGCICGSCPVTTELGLEWGYYCTRGSAAEMMEAQEVPAEVQPE